MNKRAIMLAIIILVAVGLLIFFKWQYGPTAPSSPIGQSSAGNQTTSSVTVLNPNQTLFPERQTPTTLEYHIALPNTLMLVDSQGRRTGKDPITGVLYHEIPNTTYTEDGPGSTNTVGELFAWNVSGRYTLYVLGGATGSYWVVASPRQEVRGTIQQGTMDAYALNSSSTTDKPSLIFQETYPSIASITSAPPNNLPPPPVPR